MESLNKNLRCGVNENTNGSNDYGSNSIRQSSYTSGLGLGGQGSFGAYTTGPGPGINIPHGANFIHPLLVDSLLTTKILLLPHQAKAQKTILLGPPPPYPFLSEEPVDNNQDSSSSDLPESSKSSDNGSTGRIGSKTLSSSYGNASSDSGSSSPRSLSDQYENGIKKNKGNESLKDNDNDLEGSPYSGSSSTNDDTQTQASKDNKFMMNHLMALNSLNYMMDVNHKKGDTDFDSIPGVSGCLDDNGAPYDLQAAARRLHTDFLQFCMAKESAKMLFMNRVAILQNMARLRQQSSDRTTSSSNDDPDEIKHPPRKGKKRKKSKPHPIRLENHSEMSLNSVSDSSISQIASSMANSTGYPSQHSIRGANVSSMSGMPTNMKIISQPISVGKQLENQIGSYVCRLCSSVYPDAISLANHRCREIASPQYVCPECGKKFRGPANLASHRRWHRPQPNNPNNQQQS